MGEAVLRMLLCVAPVLAALILQGCGGAVKEAVIMDLGNVTMAPTAAPAPLQPPGATPPQSNLPAPSYGDLDQEALVECCNACFACGGKQCSAEYGSSAEDWKSCNTCAGCDCSYLGSDQLSDFASYFNQGGAQKGTDTNYFNQGGTQKGTDD